MDLQDLPLDVKAVIADYLDHYSLLNLAYTCRCLNSIVTPRLYRTMMVYQSYHGIVDKLSAARNPDNPGLKHVRHVTILPHHGDTRTVTTAALKASGEQLRSIVLMLANLLPRDALHSFT